MSSKERANRICTAAPLYEFRNWLS